MACPLSLGDILAIAQICYKIGKTFATGMDEAPGELKGVENQLYALEKSLKLLDTEVKKPNSIFARGNTAEAALRLIRDCSEQLKGLEIIVEKYSGAMHNKGFRKDWIQGLRDNWMKIMWMKEENKLKDLAVGLTLHTSLITTLISVTNSITLGNIDTTTRNIDKTSNEILEAINRLLPRPYCPHSEEKRPASLPATSRCCSPRPGPPADRPRMALHKFNYHTLANRSQRPVHHPDGLPYVSEQRCSRIDNMFFELEISEEREDGKYLICPSAQLKGLHFLAPQLPGMAQEDLFQCNCKGRIRSVLSNNGHHTRQLKDYFCGPKTFIAQSYFETDTPLGGRGWWLLQTATKLGSCKNLFLVLKDFDKRPQFAKIIASMLRTNVARNVLNRIIEPFDLVRHAKNGPKPHDRLQIAWSYDERTTGRKGMKMHIDKLPWTENLEFSDPIDEPGNRNLSEKAVQDYFIETNLPGFSWYRVAMFESINITSSVEDNDLEDAYFFLDHFHTAVELKVQLTNPRDPNSIVWGVGEFGGADMTYSNKSDNDKPTDKLMFTVSRFTVEKGSPRPVNCSLYFTFRPGNSDSLTAMYQIWKRYESLSTTTGSATEFAHARPETPTKENPRFLTRVKNAVFADISITGKEEPTSLNRHGLDPIRTFRDCWVLGRRSDTPKAPLKFILRSIEQDINCHIYLCTQDARSLRRSEKSPENVIYLEIGEPTSKENKEPKISWGWIYPRDPYGTVTPPGISVCGLLKLSFASEPDLDNFLGNMRSLLDISGGAVSECHTPPPPYKESLVSEDTCTRDHACTTTRQLFAGMGHELDEDDHHEGRELDGNNYYSKPHALITPPDVVRRSKTLPSHSKPPHSVNERTASWSVELSPTPEQAAVQSSLFRTPAAPTGRRNVCVIAQGKTWETPQSHYATPGYPSHPVEPHQNLYQQHTTSGAFVMPDADHFANYTTGVDTNILNTNDPQWRNTGYPKYNHIPRASTEPIGIYSNTSPTQIPASDFPENPQPTPYGPLMSNTPESLHSPVYHPQQWQQGFNNHRVGLKRCIAVSDYQGSPFHGEVSLHAGQVYDVIPQHPDSPWVLIEEYPHGPSGFAPKKNLRECYMGPKL